MPIFHHVFKFKNPVRYFNFKIKELLSLMFFKLEIVLNWVFLSSQVKPAGLSYKNLQILANLELTC